MPVEARMEMMAHIDVTDKIDSFIRHQREAHRKSKRPQKGLKLKPGRG